MRFIYMALLLSTLAFQARAEVRVIDDRGESITLAQPANRPAAISAFAADALVELGITPVAVTQFDDEDKPGYLGETLASAISLGARGQPNLELLSGQSPDLVLAVRRYTEANAGRLQAIAPYAAFDDLTLADSLKAVTDIGTLVGKPQRAEQINQEFEQTLTRMAQQVGDRGGQSIAMLVTASEQPFVYYDHFLPVELASALGLKNVAGPSPAWPGKLPFGFRMPLEQLLAADPDILVLFPSAQPRAFVKNPLWKYLKAVRNHRVYEVGYHWKEGGGPIARAVILKQLGHLAYPDLFDAPAALPADLTLKPFS
ncbi:ABC transporter substrate-binding protein [Oceanimonas smirnovii]|uniref:ABC transporter substrate-binding protein n=1 Tax=Oceanimonas smirnovii TaxID=264574 RepID=UPI001B7FC8E9|nr:ABC transporter substrate-binding protein [Oceanimonas smirnovii]